MKPMSPTIRHALALGAALALALPFPAAAQSIAYGDPEGGDAPPAGPSGAPRRHHGGYEPRMKITPYIEAEQVVSSQLSPGSDTVTYSTIAAGVDASIRGRNNEAAVSLRYERRIGWGHKTADADAITGIARVAASVVPHTLKVEAGALAARSRVDGGDGAVLGSLDVHNPVTKVYSAYAGPTLATHAGGVAIDGGYRIGYTKVKTPNAVAAPGQAPVDVFDHSTVQNAELHAGTRPHEALPVGVGAGAGYYQEDISNLDQRIRDFHARADVTIPVAADIALIGGIGYEDVQVSSRDAVRDSAGNPVIGNDGRFVTNHGSPRQIAYQTSGLIWDAGVMWRPSRRTALEAHVGRRYGSTTYYGSFAYAPNRRSSLNISVYDSISGFGGEVNNALVALPTQFDALRNPLTGDLTGCVASLAKGTCLAGALGSVRSATFRGRGVMASYGIELDRHLQAGIAGGYDRRKFIATPGTVLAIANGVVDQNYWVAGYLTDRLDRRSSISANVYANWFQSGFASGGDTTAIGATAAYNRWLSDHLSATAALGIDGVNREALDEIWTASALVGVRYSF
ncbi:MAG: preprotein translocase subunit YajC [Novosphingobium sp.]|nr:preprotein translocase subunit YajC [Novosphingobium sp.]